MTNKTVTLSRDFDEAFQLVFEGYNRPADNFATDAAWATWQHAQLTKAFTLMQKMSAALAEPEVAFDLGRMQQALAGKRITMPEGLSREQFRGWMSEQAALADPVPPVGGGPEVLGWVVTDMNGDFYFAANRQTPGDVALVDRAHVTRLQAEVAQKSEALEVAKGMLQERVKQCAALQSELTKARECLKDVRHSARKQDWASGYPLLFAAVDEFLAQQSATAAKGGE